MRGVETLLVVEDEPQVQEMIRQVLLNQGYRVLTARDGVEALEVASEHKGPIDLLLTDVVMPRMSGWALAEQLRSTRPEMRVLYMSGYTEHALVDRRVSSEGLHFLSKPFDMETLTSKVREILDAES